VYLLTIDTNEALGRPLIVYAVDLPSNPRQPRMELARRLRTMLDHPAHFGGPAPDPLPTPDVVIGDFNMTRGSASIDALFPDLRHAFDEAGHGYSATFHRGWLLPLYHIDHMLLGPGVHALRYEITDRGVSRHRSQEAWIAAR
jgi:endonuclease/exonuclease/phosphatase family metal-dependent hydrolase